MKKLFTLLVLFLAVYAGFSQYSCEAGFTVSTDNATGATIFLDNSVYNGGPAIIDWQWEIGNGDILQGQSVTYFYQNPGVYLVCLSIVAEDSCTSTFCDSVVIGNTDPCDGLNVITQATHPSPNAMDGSINATVTGGTTPYTYLWDNGSVYSTIANLSEGTYCVEVTDASGCTATACETLYSDTNNTNCYGCNFVWTADNYNLNCGPFCYQFSFNATYCIQSVYWDFGDGSSSSEFFPVHTFAGQGTYEVCFTVVTTDGMACTYCNYFTLSGTNPCDLGTITSSTSVSDPMICNGSASVVTNLNIIGLSYQWDNGATTPTIIDLCEGQYCVTVTDISGCSDIACTYVYFDDSVNTNCYLYLDAVVTDASAYGVADGAINITVYGGAAPYTYTWANGNVNQNLNNLPAGSYTVIVTDSNGCSETITVFVGTDQGNVPVDTLWTNPYDTCITIVDYYIDTINVLDSNYVDVTWAIVDINGTNYITITYQYDITGALVVTLTIDCNGSKSFTLLHDVIQVEYSMITGFSSATAWSEFSLYPNPVNNILNVDFGGNTNITNLMIYNTTGQLLYNINVQSESTTTISTSGLNKGIYILQAIDLNGGVSTHKFIK